MIEAHTMSGPVADPNADVSSSETPKIAAALFWDAASLEKAYYAAVDRGYGSDDINVVMSDQTRQRYFSDERPISIELGTKASEGGSLGGPKGGTIGTMLPAVIALGTVLALPAIGFAVAGPIAAAVAGAGAAGVAGGLIGLLGDWGIPDDRIQDYEKQIRQGAILMALKPRTLDDARAFEEAWVRDGAKPVEA